MRWFAAGIVSSLAAIGLGVYLAGKALIREITRYA